MLRELRYTGLTRSLDPDEVEENMFQYFPGNYGWSLSFLRCLVNGGHFGEMDWACSGLKEAATKPPRGDVEAWYAAWKKLADQLDALGEERQRSGHVVTAADVYYRASQYYQWVEAFLPLNDPRAEPAYAKHLETFAKFAALASPKVEIVDIPFEGTSLKAYFVPAQGVQKGGAPGVIVAGGFDGNKEETFPLAKVMSMRGMAALALDLPGQGATMRLSGIPARHDSEVAVGAAIDYLASRGDVDIDRIGIAATSAGGYYAPRAAAFEKRIKACVPWSAIYDYYAIWQRRLVFQDGKPTGIRTDIPFPVAEALVLRIMGVDNWEAMLKKMEKFRLQGVAEKIECDLLIVQGEDDPQTPVPEAEQMFKEARSKNKELKIYRRAEGGSAHVQVDRQEPAISLIADWMRDRLHA